ncbi:MAG: DHA2 family efflux MFS transporter permease subunit [Bacilli bacterium]
MTSSIQYGGIKQVFAVSLGLFLVFLDSTVVNIAIPTIINDFSIQLSEASWIINAFVLTLAISLITFGKLADMFGRVKIFLIGLVLFTVSSLLCGIAPSIEVLVIARILQGIGGAMIIPTSMMLVRTAVPPEKTGMAMGIWGAIGALAVALGPTIGGLLTEYIDWRWIFYINVPIVILAFPFVLFAFKHHTDIRKSFSFDLFGILTLSASLYLLTYAILKGEDFGWTSFEIFTYFAGALLSAIAFIIIEKRTKEPLVDFSIFKNKAYVGGVLANFLGGALLMGTLILLPIFLTQVKGYDTITASLLITPLSGIMLIVAPLIGRMMDKIGYFVPMLIGYVSSTIAYGLLYTIDTDTSLSYLILVMCVLGTGLGTLMVTSVGVSTSSVEEHHVSLGSGIFATARNVGGAIGVALFVAITLSNLHSNTADVIQSSLPKIKEANLPPALAEKLQNKVEALQDQNIGQSQQLKPFTLTTEAKQQMLAGALQTVQKTLPNNISIPKEVQNAVQAKVNKEISRIETEINSIQSSVSEQMKEGLITAMQAAFIAGIVLTILFSFALLLVRKHRPQSSEKTSFAESLI